MSTTNVRRYLNICEVYTHRLSLWSKFYDSLRRAPHHCSTNDCNACSIVATLPTLLYQTVNARNQLIFNKRKNMQSVCLKLVDIAEKLNSAQNISTFKDLLHSAEKVTEEFYDIDWELLSLCEADKVLEKFEFLEFDFLSLKALNTVSLPFVCDFSLVPKIIW